MPLLYVFDLDDTLFREASFVESAKRAIAPERCHRGADTFAQWLDAEAAASGRTVASLLEIYRSHMPDITLFRGVAATLASLKAAGAGIIILTQGRQLTQMNKIKALGLLPLLTEPPEIVPLDASKHEAFARIDARFPHHTKISVGDNPAKDFVMPRRLGWQCIAVRNDGHNIHPQYFPLNAMPTRIINSIAELAPA